MDGLGVALLVLIIAVGVGFGVAIWRVFRRPAPMQRSMAGAPFRTPLRAIEQQASLGLVGADDAVIEAEAELGFVSAQFGDAEGREFAAVVKEARARLNQAFTLQQRLSSAEAQFWSDHKRREHVKQILGITNAIQDSLLKQQRAFDDLRRRERGAAAAAEQLRRDLDALQERWLKVGAEFRDAKERFEDPTLEHSGTITAAGSEAGTKASRLLDAVQGRLIKDPNSSVVRDLEAVEREMLRCRESVESLERIVQQLNEAQRTLQSRLQELPTAIRPALEGAAAKRASGDPALSAATDAARAELEQLLVRASGPEAQRRPLDTLRELDAASAALEAALRNERNEQQRRANAEAALVGARLIAESQIGVARDVIRRGAGAEARARLVEAERQLANAGLEAHPVDALDAARRATMLANDAEALARYDMLGRR